MSEPVNGPATLDDLRTSVQALVRKVGRGFTKPDDDWIAVAFLQAPVGMTIIAITPDVFGSGSQKSALADWLRAQMVEVGAIRYAVLLNTHMATGSAEDLSDSFDRVERGEVRVEQLPGAIEQLVMTVGDAEEEHVWFARILRNDRLIRKLGRWERMDETFVGRFVGLNSWMRTPRV